jgi:hypothetical protein
VPPTSSQSHGDGGGPDPMLVWEPKKYTELEDERMKECLEIVSGYLNGKGS